MKRLIIIISILLIIQNSGYCADFYPEMGMDPFFSSLNPQYIPQEDDQESIFELIKKKKEVKSEKQEKTTKTSVINIERTEDEEKNIESSTKSVFITTEKKKSDDIQPKEKRRIFFKKKKVKEVEQPIPETASIQLTADYMEYYPDRYEIEATGNAKVEFTKEKTILCAEKIIFNYDRNILKAKENVVLISKESVTEGDFLKIDLSTPDGWIENPITTTQDIKLSAKEGVIYSDKIEEYDGVAKILRNDVIAFRARSFASYVDQGGVFNNTYNNKKHSNSGIYTLKANTIYIDSKQDHEVITIKNADLYLKKYKLASIPSTKIVSNKQNNVIESNIPEIGSHSMLGFHAGPAVVLNIPGGSTLKLAPIVTYSKEKLGFGGIARYRNQSNMTEVAYGTSRDEVLIRGRQKLAPGLTLHYSRMTNESEWFLGYRRPKYSANLVYSRNDYVKDLRLHFAQQYSAGVFVDNRRNIEMKDAEARFRWMTQSFKNIYSYKNEEGNVRYNSGLVAQTAASVYTTGDVLGLVRVGPAINSQVGPWTQSLMYLQTGSAGRSPFAFDRYRYGSSNVVLIESLRVCKYISLGYLTSLAINRDKKYKDDLFQENRFFVSVGPEYARVTLGYDAYRQNTMLIFSMLVGTKDSDIEFKKSILKNPDSVGKTKKKKQEPKKNYKKIAKQKV